jgi:hypothetical protein
MAKDAVDTGVATGATLPQRDGVRQRAACLCLSSRFDQHVAGNWFDGDGDAEDGLKRGLSGAAAVEAETEFIEPRVRLDRLKARSGLTGPRPASDCR